MNNQKSALKDRQQSGTDQSLYWGLRAKEFYTALRDKPIQITALDGKIYRGVLVGHDQYDVFIRQPSGLTILFAKHSIKLIHEGGE